MKSLNRFQFIGNLGQDAEQKFTQGGIAVSTLNLATTRSFKKNDEWQDITEWFRCTLWRNEGIIQYLTKGTKVFVEGHIENRSYEKDGEKKYTTEFIVSDIVLCGGAAAGGGKGEPKGSASKPSGRPSSPPVDDDSDVPF